MMEGKKKSWFRKHWIISIVLGFMVIGMFGSIFNPSEDNLDITGNVVDEQFEEVKQTCTPNWNCDSWSECSSSEIQTRICTDFNNCGINSGKPQTSQSCEYVSEEIIEVSIEELYEVFWEYSDLTDLQKDNLYKTKYKDKIIKTSIVADTISESSLFSWTGQYVVKEMSGPYSCFAKAFFSSSEKDKLLKANIGNKIIFEGKLVNYDFGITSCLEFDDAKVLDIQQ